MVGVAQLVECKIVALVVVGSSPIVHPIFECILRDALFFECCTVARFGTGVIMVGQGTESVLQWPIRPKYTMTGFLMHE